MDNKQILYAPGSHLKLIEIGNNQFSVYLTNHIVNLLKNPNYIDYPQVGTIFNSQEQFGCIETGKLTFSLSLPFAGEILEVNAELPITIEQAINNVEDAFLCVIQIVELDYGQFLVNEEEYNEYIGL